MARAGHENLQSNFNPALSITAFHCGTSSAMRARNASGPRPVTAKPALRSLPRISGRASSAVTSLASRSTISRRRAGGHQQALPGFRRRVGDAGLQQRRHLRQVGPAGAPGHRQAAQLAALDLRHRHRQRGDRRRHRAAEQRRRRRTRAAERHVHHVDPAAQVDEFADQVRQRAGPRRRIAEGAGLCLGARDERRDRDRCRSRPAPSARPRNR